MANTAYYRTLLDFLIALPKLSLDTPVNDVQKAISVLHKNVVAILGKSDYDKAYGIRKQFTEVLGTTSDIETLIWEQLGDSVIDVFEIQKALSYIAKKVTWYRLRADDIWHVAIAIDYNDCVLALIKYVEYNLGGSAAYLKDMDFWAAYVNTEVTIQLQRMHVIAKLVNVYRYDIELETTGNPDKALKIDKETILSVNGQPYSYVGLATNY